MGNLSASNLKYSIETKKTISFERFIFALGIRHIGLENSKLISKYLKTPQKFFDLSESKINDLLNIDGIGETQTNSLLGFSAIKLIKKYYLNLKKNYLLIMLKLVSKMASYQIKLF